VLNNAECRETLKNKNLKEEDVGKIAVEMSLLADLLLDIYFAENKPCQNQRE